ncbi:unannotated protein [freshwater metagenome]|uniref:Unannotated protein n=1 Tax=freshwater metagenome TaxID=449393 RepID=A0A6J7HGV3_9ZZZZ
MYQPAARPRPVGARTFTPSPATRSSGSSANARLMFVAWVTASGATSVARVIRRPATSSTPTPNGAPKRTADGPDTTVGRGARASPSKRYAGS